MYLHRGDAYGFHCIQQGNTGVGVSTGIDDDAVSAVTVGILDLVYQKHIFSLISDWLKTPGRAVLSVVHDLSLARRYGTHAVLMNRGKCAAQGEINAVLTPDNLRSVYDMDVYAWMHEMLEQWK